MEFLFADWLGTPVWFWLAFIAIVIALTAFDLGILHRESREMGIGESLRLSALYIGIALAFGGWIWAAKGSEAGLQYYTGFFIEKALSIDNIFVISLIRSEEHTSELQSLMRISYAVFCLKKKTTNKQSE